MNKTQTASVLHMQGITKYFPGVKALSNVDLKLYQGEVLALIGENGAGKSTLMNILGGVYQPDAGTITLYGQPTSIHNVHHAMDLGIAFVHQELNLCDNLDVAANIFLGRESYASNLLKLMNKKQMYMEAERILQRINMLYSPKTLVRDLTIGAQQVIEIAKALSLNAKILILDEPTSSLSQNETEQLFRIIKELKNQRVSIIYISHRMGEVKEVADRVIVLRDGSVSGHLQREEISHERMIRLMVGRDIETFYRSSHKVGDIPVLEVKDLEVPGQRGQKLNFAVHAGEIVVLTGLVGSGRTELIHTLFGIDQPLDGQILLHGKPITIKDPEDAIEAGIGLVPEDRKQHGLIVSMTVAQNITLAGLRWWHNRLKMMVRHTLQNIAEKMTTLLNVRMTSLQQITESLSGGNQQKMVMAKWLALKPKLLLLDEPTRGIDVIAKGEIYRLMEELASQGVAMLVISSEMQEVLRIADRILVMHEGRISGELGEPAEFNEEAIVTLATGGI